MTQIQLQNKTKRKTQKSKAKMKISNNFCKMFMQKYTFHFLRDGAISRLRRLIIGLLALIIFLHNICHEFARRINSKTLRFFSSPWGWMNNKNTNWATKINRIKSWKKKKAPESVLSSCFMMQHRVSASFSAGNYGLRRIVSLLCGLHRTAIMTKHMCVL